MDLKETMVLVGGILLFFGMLVFVCGYSEALRADCRLAAINKGYTAVEVQAICK